MSKQAEIVQSIIDKLKEITTANGYETNIGNNVNDWNSDKIQEGILNYVEVRDAETLFSRPGDPGYFEAAHKQNIQFQILVFFEKEPITTSRKAVVDIYKMIGSNRQYFWDTQQIVIRPIKHLFDIAKEDRTLSGINVLLDVEFVTTLWGLDV